MFFMNRWQSPKVDLHGGRIESTAKRGLRGEERIAPEMAQLDFWRS